MKYWKTIITCLILLLLAVCLKEAYFASLGDNITSYTFTPYDPNVLKAYTVEYDYHYVDNQKKKITVKDASGNKIYQANYFFDDAARLTWLDSDPNGNVDDLISSFSYDDNGNRSQLCYWLGNTMLFNLDYTYNADNLLTGYCNSQDGPTFTFDADEVGGVDGMGRLKNATEQLIGTAGSTVEHVLDYTYDGMGQLLTAEVSNIDGSPWDIAYTYAKDGNIKSLTINGSEPVNFGYDIDDDGTNDGDMMTDIGDNSISWDVPNGTTSNNLVASFVYDWDNKLRTASFGDSNSLEIKYDPRGNRIYRSIGTGVNKSERQYIVDIVGKLPVILCEIDPDDCSLKNRYYYANSQPLAQDILNTPSDPNDCNHYYYLHDRLGSVRMMIDPNVCIADPNGSVVNTYMYKPFGEDFDTEIDEQVYNPFKFTGQWYDAEIAQYYLRARQYDPMLMRFTSRDPVKGKFHGPLTLHKYLYTENEPINSIDPRGEAALNIANGLLTATDIYAVGVGVAAYGANNGNLDLVIAGGFIMEISVPVGMAMGMAHPACFTEGTTILTALGGIPIEEVEVGDYVWGANPETGNPWLYEVVQCFVREVDSVVNITIGEDQIYTTYDHPFYVHGYGWQKAGELKIGTPLCDLNGNPVVITDIETLSDKRKVYNFEVASSHTYYVSTENILVHNKCRVFRDNKGKQVGIDYPKNMGGHGHDFHMHFGKGLENAIYANGVMRHGTKRPSAKQWQIFIDFLMENAY